MGNSKICVTCPHLYMPGGVTNYYNIIGKYLNVDVRFFQVGARKNGENTLLKASHLVTDIQRFRSHLGEMSSDYDLIHVNPSLDFKAIVRDGMLLLQAKRFGHKVLVFIHGWHSFEKNVHSHLRNLFISVYGRADAFIVLAKEFREKLLGWGIRKPIFIGTTPVDDEWIKDIELEKRLRSYHYNRKIQILFLARIIKAKGIFEAIYSLNHLKQSLPNARLSIAGDGPDLSEARKLVDILELTSRVDFLGYVRGAKKREVLSSSDIYLLPSYSEGMPTSLLEALAFGLPVITYPVGGIKDFFEDGKHGFLSKSIDPSGIASLIVQLVRSPGLLQKMSRHNHRYARDHFAASKVAKRLENIYDQLINV